MLRTIRLGFALLFVAAAATAAEDILIADFEGKDYGEWKAEGEAFGPGPARGTLPQQMQVEGFLGKGLVSSFFKGDGATGTLTSPPFKIERKFLCFPIGGGGYAGETCMNLLVEGKVARTATGPNIQGGGSEQLAWHSWDVAELAGKEVAIQIVDQHTGGWGHVNVDHIVQSDHSRNSWTARMLEARRAFQEDTRLGPWHTTGPLPSKGFGEALFPETEVALDARDDAGGPRWTPAPEHQDGKVNALPGPPGTTTYLARVVTLPRAARLLVQIGSSDGRELRLNGKKVLSRDVRGPARPNQDRVELDFKQGENTLLLKVHHAADGHAFCVQVEMNRMAEQLWREVLPRHPELCESLARDLKGGYHRWLSATDGVAAEKELIGRALEAADAPGGALRGRAAELEKAGTPPADPAWLDTYAQACTLRDRVHSVRGIESMLATAGNAPPLRAELDELQAKSVDLADERWDSLSRKAAAALLAHFGASDLVFAVRKVDGDGHWYANFSYWSDNPKRTLYHDGGRLCRLQVATGEVKTLLDDPESGVRDPQLHYGGQKILFSYRKGGQPFYHLHEINTDGTGLRRLTDGPFDDIEPTYLPDGGIAFCSSRCNRMVNCYFVRVAVIYRCDADGGNIRQLSSNIEQDNTPWVLPDGRILHQRWEYIDRSQVAFHHLWTMNPDGTGQMVYYGNLHGSTVMIDAKPIPGTNKVVASFSPGHGQLEHAGVVTIVDPTFGPDHQSSAQAVTSGRGPHWRDPYPLSESWFLVAGDTEICLLDGQGRHWVVYDLPAADRSAGLKMHEPRPIRPRPRERVIPSFARLTQPTGRLFLEDIYVGRNMAGVQRGEVKKLLVLEALPKPVNFSGAQEPLSLGGTFTLERILGTVPVEADGSACFDAPALRSIFLVALDEHDLSVKRMQSFLTVQPGESLSCVGCHEDRYQTPRSATQPMALLRLPSAIEPIAGVPDVIDFPRDVQPILDRHCLACHDYGKTAQGGPRAGGVILSGDRGPWYSHSYVELTERRQFSDGRNGGGNRPPRSIGSSASPLMKKLDGQHYDAKLSPREKTLVRLWIDSAAAYPGTYAALGSGMVGEPSRLGPIRKVLDSRCAQCHPSPPASWHSAYNLTRPDKSLVLLAPLAPAAGGYGMRRKTPKDGKAATECVVAFKDTSDPDYQALLKGIVAAKAQLDAIKRFDMPGFRPNEHYVREMKVYGVLPADLPDDAPLDVYATDQAYWRSLWYRPPAP